MKEVIARCGNGSQGGGTAAAGNQRPRFCLKYDQEVVLLRTFTAYVEWDPQTKLYVGMVPGIPGAHTQAENLDELRRNLEEVLSLCLEEYEGTDEDLPRFVGVQQIEVTL